MKKIYSFAFALLMAVGISAKTVKLDTLQEMNIYYVLQHNDVVIGTMQHAFPLLRIANNATVTLQGVDINGSDNISGGSCGIECLGNATIKLVGTNTVHSLNYDRPGIFVPQDYTLTIQGTGTLNVSAREEIKGLRIAAGIGSCLDPGYQHCGNIVINSGIINAQGGESSAAIGSGSNGASPFSCGNITINGGTVTATGGDKSCGIGAGVAGVCGNITINRGVAKVTATKGSSALCSIGKSSSGATCGTITIGGILYPNGVTKSPYVYVPANEPVVYTVFNGVNTLTYYYDNQYDASNPNHELYDPNNSSAKRWINYHAKVTKVVIDPSMSNANLPSLARMFYGGSVSNNGTNTYYSLSKLDTIIGLENLNMTYVTSLQSMFNRCTSLKSLNLQSFKTSNVTSMKYMFVYCKALTSLNLNYFDMDNVTTTEEMFYGCSALKTLICVYDWSTLTNITSSNKMFNNCTALVGGNGTVFDANHIDITYARPDQFGQPGYFTVKGEGIDEINAAGKATKIIRDGKLFIEINGRTYDAQGKELR